MNVLESLVDLLRNPGALIAWGGYPALAVIVFLETGALVFFLPGDSLLVMAGLYAAKGDLSLVALNALLIPMAILGDAVSYWLGRRGGASVLGRHGRFLRPEHVAKARAFYDRHGGKAIVLARFLPIVRTFVPVVAGVAGMPYRRFALYNVIGGVAWVASMTCLGWGLGRRFPALGEHVEKVILAVVLLSVVPAAIEWARSRRRSRARAAPAGTVEA
jgi:membrane-associated protein